jgi:hypothetical protein
MRADPETVPPFEQVICTLYERDHHLGTAVLINSCVRAGFRGLFWVGNRGELPPWTVHLKQRENGLYEVGDALLGFSTVKDNRHFGQFKPSFLIGAIQKGIATKYLWYFDPDITVRGPWSFFERWLRFGVSLCQDSNFAMMPDNHPIRLEWIELARNVGWQEPARRLDRYFNSGFVGLDIQHRNYLDTWEAALQLANASGVMQDHFQKGSRAQTFFTIDQDTMNIAAMYSSAPLTTLGTEGMGWTPGGFTMYHSVGQDKPWRKPFLRALIRGYPPNNGDKHFLALVDGPIWPFSAAKLKRMRRNARIAAFFGRFYSRR